MFSNWQIYKQKHLETLLMGGFSCLFKTPQKFKDYHPLGFCYMTIFTLFLTEITEIILLFVSRKRRKLNQELHVPAAVNPLSPHSLNENTCTHNRHSATQLNCDDTENMVKSKLYLQFIHFIYKHLMYFFG